MATGHPCGIHSQPAVDLLHDQVLAIHQQSGPFQTQDFYISRRDSGAIQIYSERHRRLRRDVVGKRVAPKIVRMMRET
jgi:hypothetical protein